MKTTVVVIGAGPAGLAMSRCLADPSIDHVVLKRGEVANSWKTERWDSLRLLTPNWQSRLPGFGYEGHAPDDFRDMEATIGFIERYARVVDAPVRTHATVMSVRAAEPGYAVATDRGTWRCRAVVIATGACNVPRVPGAAADIPARVRALTPMEYRNPGRVEEGGVLVVGASATGVQLAAELQQAGRRVTLSVGEHIRAPRTYRGRDIQRWMDDAGVLDDHYSEVDNLTRVRTVPSLQLVGSDDRRTLDLNALSELGVRITGRLAGVRDGRVLFSGSRANQCALSDLKMNRLLDRIDAWASEAGMGGEVEPPRRFEPTRVETPPPLSLDLRAEGIRTVLWATGYRPDYAWLDVPVIDAKGQPRHDGGAVDAPGMYVVGLPFLRRRKSSLVDGAGDDARELSAHLAAFLGGRPASVPSGRGGGGAQRALVPA